MKFSHQLKFNSVADWKDHYIHYANLKKIIYEIARLEQASQQPNEEDWETGVHEPLLRTGSLRHVDTKAQVAAKEAELMRELDKELADIISFFMRKEADTISRLEILDLEIHSYEKHRRTASGSLEAVPEDGELGAPPGAGGPPGTPPRDVSVRGASASSAEAGAGAELAVAAAMSDEEAAAHARATLARITSMAPRPMRVQFWSEVASRREGRELRMLRDKLRQRFTDIFTTLNDLVEYLELNREGFRKVIKKHDKLCTSSLKDSYWPLVEAKYPSKKKEELQRHLERLVDLYSVLYSGGDSSRAKEALSKNLRDHIKVERNTVWRDMVALERRTVAATVEATAAAKRIPWYVRHRDMLALSLCVLVFALVLSHDFFEEPEKNNCLALLVFASMLWATEAVPLFATAMLVPVLVVVLRVLVDRTNPASPQRMTPPQAAPAIFHAMFSQTIMLLLGGFSIAAALSKHFIAKQLAVAVLSRVGRKPRNVLLASMFVATFASMWISNVAAPVLCFSLVQPILRTMDVNTPFAKSLVMGIALASNIGGMTSPISSPQNIFAIERMSMDGKPPSWLAWFAVALPVAVISNFVCWGLILAVYQPWRKTQEVRPLKPNTDPTTATQVFVIIVSVVTVGLWCANSVMRDYTGEMGVVAVLPMIAFFGFGVLSKDDFNGFLWNVVMLAMGGMALGEAVKSSGLLATMAEAIKDMVAGMDLWMVTVSFCGVVLVCTTFISHTVGAMVILPIVQSVGEGLMPTPHPKLLVMASALMCSGAMGLPVSGFPNMQAVSLEDSTGQTFVNTLDFVKVGVPSSVFAYGVIVTVGYSLMKLVGF
uniref:SPX domain-containing protein n=1 Tax=Chlamydomonas leiostraca TaxID=1034604 RepID=A0A7S0WPN7_9CHLO|mmetsp:Transcript_21687/g.55212  ORF Transcript_21687/g.55212 Transcript_21687/m.55212 type:complete len:828 (+) Transcript_21687:186-2669(+)